MWLKAVLKEGGAGSGVEMESSNLSEPSPRWGHYSAAVRGQLYVYGGRTRDFSNRKSEVAVSVHSFNQCVETWQSRATTGKHPPSLYSGACTSSGHHLYIYGGSDELHFHDSLHQLDTKSMEWLQLPSGPMKKWGCKMISYEDNLVLFGGYGIPSGPIQPGAQFVQDNSMSGFSDGRGMTNELHMFNLQKSELSYS